MAQKITVLLLMVVFVMATGPLFAAQLSLQPATKSIVPNEEFVVTIFADTQNGSGEGVVVADAVINYETDMLELLSIDADDPADSDFYYDFQLPPGKFPLKKVDNKELLGLAQVVVGKPGTEAVAANQTGVRVAKLRFRAKTPAESRTDLNTNVSIVFSGPGNSGESHLVKNDGQGTDILESVSGATYAMILAPDSDGDGVADSTDNCPTVSNATQDDNGGVNSSLPDNIGDACQCGDMNADGKVTNTDAVLIQRHLLGLPSPFNESLCDVNGDSNCSNTDAVIIKRAVLALPPGVGQVCTAVVAVP